MLKYFTLFVLINIICGTPFLAQQSNAIDWKALEQCITDIDPIATDIIDIIAAIKAKDASHVIDLIYKLIEDGNTTFLQCIQIMPQWKEYLAQLIKFDWNDLIECILDTHDIADDVLELVQTILKKDYPQTLALIYQLMVEGTETVKQCINVFKQNINGIRVFSPKLPFNPIPQKKSFSDIQIAILKLQPLDWKAIEICLSNSEGSDFTSPQVLNVIELIKADNPKKAITFAYLSKSHPIVFEKCMIPSYYY